MNKQEKKAYVKEKAKELTDLMIYFAKNFQGMSRNEGEKKVQDFILSIIKDFQPKINREWVYYFCAYINAGHESSADDKERVEHAIKKLKEKGVEVEE